MSEESLIPQSASRPSPLAHTPATWTAELINLFGPLDLSQRLVREWLARDYDINLTTYRLLTWLQGAEAPLTEESPKILAALRSLAKRKANGEDLKQVKPSTDIWVDPTTIDDDVNEWLASGLTLSELAQCAGRTPDTFVKWVETQRVRKSDWKPVKTLLDGITKALRMTRNTEPLVAFNAWLTQQSVPADTIRLLLGLSDREFSIYVRTDRIRPTLLRQAEAILTIYLARQKDLGLIETPLLVAELTKRHPELRMTLKELETPLPTVPQTPVIEAAVVAQPRKRSITRRTVKSA